MWFTVNQRLPPHSPPHPSPCPLGLSPPSPADWIIERWTEDSWKDWLPERSRRPTPNTNLQKLWEKATNSSIFTVSSHRCVLWEEEGEGCRAWMPAWTYRWSEVAAAPECWSDVSNNSGVTVVHCFSKTLKGELFYFSNLGPMVPCFGALMIQQFWSWSSRP